MRSDFFFSRKIAKRSETKIFFYAKRNQVGKPISALYISKYLKFLLRRLSFSWNSIVTPGVQIRSANFAFCEKKRKRSDVASLRRKYMDLRFAFASHFCRSKAKKSEKIRRIFAIFCFKIVSEAIKS